MALNKNFTGSSEKGAGMPSAGAVWCVDSSKLCGDDGPPFGLSLPLPSTARQTAAGTHKGNWKAVNGNDPVFKPDRGFFRRICFVGEPELSIVQQLFQVNRNIEFIYTNIFHSQLEFDFDAGGGRESLTDINGLIDPASPNFVIRSREKNKNKMERDEFYKHLPPTHLRISHKVKDRVEVFEELENRSFKNKATGRIMSAKTFEIYKPAAAFDGITTITMEYVPLEKPGF